MQLDDVEKAMRGGELGEPRRWAIEQQVSVGSFFGAERLVPISQVHICADAEALGGSGLALLEKFAGASEEFRRVVVPSLTDPRGSDFRRYREIRQSESIVDRERRLSVSLEKLGFLMTNTCINYQCVMPPLRGEHLAFGDTGSVIYANSIQGASSNFEGGPAALAAALTGRVPGYGFHLAEQRRGTHLFRIVDAPRDLADWGALGGVIGKSVNNYWHVPVIEAAWSDTPRMPSSDELKHLGAAMASYGSLAMFHFVGVTPEAPDRQAAFGGAAPMESTSVSRKDLSEFYESFDTSTDQLDVVVFAAPQLSLLEVEQLCKLLDGRRIADSTAMLIAVPPSVKVVADQMGITEQVEAAGAFMLEGVCFYQMHARELGEANGWRTLMSNSAKLVNIVGGYGYEPVLGTMEACVEAAVNGRLVR